jgi:tetratricopeptide (TPR) repeat protein
VIEAARRAAGRTPTPKEVSAYWSQKAWRDIGADPCRWFRLLAYKTALFANHAEIPDNYNYSFMSGRFAPLRFNPFGFWILAPFAIAGLGVAIARGGRWKLIVLVALVYTGSVFLFYVTARYRAPVVPFLALLAALAVEQLVAWLKKQDFQRALVFCVVIFGLFVAVSKPLVPENLGFDREYYALGNMEMERGNFEGAIESYLSALDSRSYSPEIENNLGAAYLSAAGRNGINRSIYLEAAAFHLRLAVELNPHSFEAWKNLGLAQSAAGHTENARRALLRALELAPGPHQHGKVRRILKSISQ